MAEREDIDEEFEEGFEDEFVDEPADEYPDEAPTEAEGPTGPEGAPPAKAPRRFSPVALAILAGMAVAIAISIFFTLRFIEGERERDRLNWQVRLGIVADSRAGAVNEWIEENFGHMRELAQNASLQLYLSEAATKKKKPGGGLQEFDGGAIQGLEGDLAGELAATPDASAATEGVDALEEDTSAAALGFLRNLLVVTADRTGFKAPPPTAEVAANVERPGVAGIGLVDAKGNTVIATPDMPPMTRRIREAVKDALEGEPAIIDVFKGPSNEPTIGFAMPVYAVQGGGAGAKGIGAVVGVKIIDDDLFKRLVQPGELSTSAETYIVRRAGSSVEYLTPLADGTKPMARRMAVDTKDLAAAYALEKPGGFATKRDYGGTEVLVASRSLSSVPWILVRKVSTEEALASTETRLRTILIVLVLIIVGVTVAIFAVWGYGSSVRASQAMANMELALERFTNMSKFMKVVTNSQPTEIVAVDGDTHYTFANEPAASAAGISTEDMLGKTMASVMGPIKAQRFAEINAQALRTFERIQEVSTFDNEHDPEDVQVIKSDHIPLRGDRDHPPGVLMVLEDISELSRERRRSERMMRQLIDTLVSVVDRRDPYSAHHSTRVAEVAREIASEMGLGTIEAKTVDIAGSLMNLGKIFVPPELLTKTGNLSDEEKETLASTYLVTADLLREVTFDGPVVKTILHMGENYDGSGRFHISGERIITTAQILAVANAFVGMVSARAWRPAMEFRKAVDILMQDTGAKYDRRVVSALMNFLENRDGAEKWSHFRDPPESDEPLMEDDA